MDFCFKIEIIFPLVPHGNCENLSDKICYRTGRVFIHPPTCINKLFLILPADNLYCPLKQLKPMPGFMFSPSVFGVYLGLQLLKLNSSDRVEGLTLWSKACCYTLGNISSWSAIETLQMIIWTLTFTFTEERLYSLPSSHSKFLCPKLDQDDTIHFSGRILSYHN